MAAAPSRGLELLQYLGVISRLARDNPSSVWLHYDKQFRQMAAAVPQSTKWDELHFQFLQWAKQEPSSSSSRDPCKRWNEGRYCQYSSCKRDHVCSICNRAHRAISCSSSRAAPYPPPPPRGTWGPRLGPVPLPPWAQHVAGSANGPADSISRNNLSLLLFQVPNASREPTPLQDDLWTLLVREQPDWLSERWKTLFTSFCKKVWPVPRGDVTSLVNADSCLFVTD